ncbi:MAG: hypothetical protein ACOYJX_01570 [Acutalibacteraceae bacterium]
MVLRKHDICSDLFARINSSCAKAGKEDYQSIKYTSYPDINNLIGNLLCNIARGGIKYAYEKNLFPSLVSRRESMDYSAFYPSILINYFVAFAGIIIAIILLVVSGAFLLKRYLKSKSVIELVGVVACIVAIVAVAYFSRNFFKDIPNVLSENYIVTSGTAQGWDSAGQVHETRGFAFKRDDGEIAKIVVTYPPVYQGDRFEVIYLPNTGYGAIVKKYKVVN